MNKLYLLCLISITITLGGCLGTTDVLIRKGIDTGQIRLGSSKAAVGSVVTQPSFLCTHKRIKTDGVYEMWDYASRGCGFNMFEAYALIFKDDQLIEIRTISHPADLQF